MKWPVIKRQRQIIFFIRFFATAIYIFRQVEKRLVNKLLYYKGTDPQD